MITLTWWQLVGLILLNHVLISLASGIISTIRWYRRTCPKRRTLALSQIDVRCSVVLNNRECPDHGRVR